VSRARALLLPFSALLTVAVVAPLSGVGCRDRCSGYWDEDWYEPVWVDTGGIGWVDTGYFAPWYGGSVEVGVGTRDFIWVPPGEQVSPELDSDPPYFNVALRTWSFDRRDLTVTLRALVDGRPYAEDRYEGVRMQCKSNGQLEVGALRLHLDPADLPPYQPLPTPIPNDEPDTGWAVRDSGEWVDTGGWVDTGYWVEPQGDVEIVAEITGPSGARVEGRALWHVYR
jgi:hypothetical protein